MPTYMVTAPDGRKYRVTAPEGATEAEIRARVANQPSAPRSTADQLRETTTQRAAAVAKGALSIPDIVTEGVAGLTRMVIDPAARASASIYDAVGMPGAAKRVRKNAGMFGRGLSRPATFRRGIEQFVKPPTTTAGKVADFGAEMLGAALVPMGATPKQRARFPTPTPPPSQSRKVIEAGNREGVRVLTSDVKPPKTFVGKAAQATGERIPFAGTGGVRMAQQEERANAVRNLITRYGADDQSRPLASELADDLTKTRSARLEKLTAAKNGIIDQFDGPVDVSRVTGEIDNQIARLKEINPEKLRPVIAELEVWKRTLPGKTLRQLEDNRKLMGEAFNKPELGDIAKFGQQAVNAVYAPLRDDMGAFIAQRGGKAAYDTWRSANDELAGMAGELSSGTFRRTLNTAQMTPENVSAMLFNNKASDASRLVENLSPDGRTLAGSAFLQKAAEKAGGLDNISPDKFASEIGRQSDNLRAVLPEDEFGRIDDLASLLKATSRAGTSAAHPPTGAQNWPAIGAMALTDLMGGMGQAVTAGGLFGMGARLYESPAVRDRLIKSAVEAAQPAATGMGARAVAPTSLAATRLLEELIPANSLLRQQVGSRLAASDREEDKRKKRR